MYNAFQNHTICTLHSTFHCKERISIYDWLLHVLQEEYEQVRQMKEGARGSVWLIRHKATGQRFILHRFAGNAEVYRKLLDYTCPYLPTVYEVAEKDGENLVLEEFIEGDTLGFLLQDTLFSTEETRKIATQVCGRCGCSTPSVRSTGM